MSNHKHRRLGQCPNELYLSMVILLGTALPAQGEEINPGYWMANDGTEYYEVYHNQYTTEYSVVLPDGTEIEGAEVNGPPKPPPGYEFEQRAIPTYGIDSVDTTKLLNQVPKFKWVFGCGAVSGAMIAGYYDRMGYPNIYTGPTNGGVIPPTNDPATWGATWPLWKDSYNVEYPSCSLIATKTGVDGRVSRGSINDYWVKYLSTANDPYITNGWTQHAWGEAIGDYMKTSQSAYGIADGSSWIYWGGGNTRLDCTSMTGDAALKDGTNGMRQFYIARGYTVSTCYNQLIDNQVAGGFSYAQFKAEIDAGRPVYIYLVGHFVVGVGYDDSANKIYIHDTWDYNVHEMTWGSTYSGMQHKGVGVIGLTPSAGTGWLAGINASGYIYYSTNLATFANIPGFLTQIVTADLDGNGSADIAGLNSAGQIWYSLNRSSWVNIPGALVQLVTGDFDGNGRADLAGVNSSGGIYYTLNLNTWTRIPGALSKLVAGNFDSDSADELAGLNSAGQIWVTTNMSTWGNIPGILTQLVVGEFNGNPSDGKELAGINSAGQIFYTPYFSYWTNIPGTLKQLVAGNFNNSGNSDLAGINNAGNIYYTTNLSNWNSIPGRLDYLVAGNINNSGIDDLAGLTWDDQIYYATNLSNWVNIPGRLYLLALRKGN